MTRHNHRENIIKLLRLFTNRGVRGTLDKIGLNVRSKATSPGRLFLPALIDRRRGELNGSFHQIILIRIGRHHHETVVNSIGRTPVIKRGVRQRPKTAKVVQHRIGSNNSFSLRRRRKLAIKNGRGITTKVNLRAMKNFTLPRRPEPGINKIDLISPLRRSNFTVNERVGLGILMLPIVRRRFRLPQF